MGALPGLPIGYYLWGSLGAIFFSLVGAAQPFRRLTFRGSAEITALSSLPGGAALRPTGAFVSHYRRCDSAIRHVTGIPGHSCLCPQSESGLQKVDAPWRYKICTEVIEAVLLG